MSHFRLAAICFYVLFLVSFPAYNQAQVSETRSSLRMQAGISSMPVFDILHHFPDNKINGAAVVANFGCFLHQRLSFGVNPYYATISNQYLDNSSFVAHEKMITFGLNAYLRAYAVDRTHLSVFVVASGGFGVMNQMTSVRNPKVITETSYWNSPLVSLFAGPGVAWKLNPTVDIEVNLPAAVLLFGENYLTERSFVTVLPTLGMQFHW